MDKYPLQTCSFDLLPDEILSMIFLNIKDWLPILSQVNFHWRSIIFSLNYKKSLISYKCIVQSLTLIEWVKSLRLSTLDMLCMFRPLMVIVL